MRADQSFFDRSHLTVARELIGCTLVWDTVGGIVVETEAYAAHGDPACHTSFRPSARRFFDEHPPGTTYVYRNYGIHWLLNVLARDGIILFRAIEPTLGIDQMRLRRSTQNLRNLCSGPGKIGQAFALDHSDHGSSLLTPQRNVISGKADLEAPGIVADVRVGISKAIDFPWRFLMPGNPHLSVPVGQAGRTHRKRRDTSPLE